MPLKATFDSMRESTGAFDWVSFRPGAPSAADVGGSGQGQRLSDAMAQLAQELSVFAVQQEQQQAQGAERAAAIELRASALESRTEALERRTGRDAARIESVEGAARKTQQRIDAFFSAINLAQPPPEAPAAPAASQAPPAPPAPPAPQPAPPPPPRAATAPAGRGDPRSVVDRVNAPKAPGARAHAGPSDPSDAPPPLLIDTLTDAELEAEAAWIWQRSLRNHKQWLPVGKGHGEPLIRMSHGKQDFSDATGRSIVYVFDCKRAPGSKKAPPPLARFAARAFSVAAAKGYRDYVLRRLGFAFELSPRGEKYKLVKTGRVSI